MCLKTAAAHLKTAAAHPIYVHFERTIEEVGGNHKCTFHEDTTLFLLKFMAKIIKTYKKSRKTQIQGK